MLQESLVTALSGVAGARIYPMLAPQPATTPYVVYTRVVSQVENVMAGNGNPPINQTRLQIDVYSKTYSEANSVAQAVTAAMLAWNIQNVNISSQDLFEPDTRLYRVMLEYSIWHASP